MGQDRGTAALGVQLQRGNAASPEVFTAIAEIVDLNGPNIKLNTVESTHHGDTWINRKATLLDAGSVTISINYIPTDATQSFTASTGIAYDMVNRTLRNFKIVWPDGLSTPVQFAAFVTDFAVKAPLNGMFRADLTLQISGAPIWT